MRSRQPIFLNDEESFKLEAACYRSRHLTRDRLFVAFGLQLGMRLSEILNLRFENIEGDWVRIMRKGEKEQRLPLTPSLKTLLEYWKKERQAQPEEWIFPGQKLGSPMTARNAQVLLRKLAERSGISKQVSPHALRHTFATTLAARGASLVALKELLGHQRITTTERYTHVTPTYLKETLALLQKPIRPN